MSCAAWPSLITCLTRKKKCSAASQTAAVVFEDLLQSRALSRARVEGLLVASATAHLDLQRARQPEGLAFRLRSRCTCASMACLASIDIPDSSTCTSLSRASLRSLPRLRAWSRSHSGSFQPPTSFRYAMLLDLFAGLKGEHLSIRSLRISEMLKAHQLKRPPIAGKSGL